MKRIEHKREMLRIYRTTNRNGNRNSWIEYIHKDHSFSFTVWGTNFNTWNWQVTLTVNNNKEPEGYVQQFEGRDLIEQSSKGKADNVQFGPAPFQCAKGMSDSRLQVLFPKINILFLNSIFISFSYIGRKVFVSFAGIKYSQSRLLPTLLWVVMS